MLVLILSVIAFFAASLSGMAGIGGGTILIAAMYALGLTPTVAVPVHAGVQLVSNGSRTLAYLKHVNWPALRDFLIGVVPAPFIIAPLIARIETHTMQLFMAGFILLTLWPRWLRLLRMEGRGGMVAAGVITGGLGSMVGASGTMIGPFFMRTGWSRETVIATLAMCQSVGHLMKIIAFGAYGFGIAEHWKLLLPMCIAVVAGTFLGRGIGKRFSDEFFEWVFRGIMAVLALKLAWDGATGLWGSPFA